MAKERFRKRLYSLAGFLAAVGWAIGHPREVRAAMRHPVVDGEFGERIMLAVTGVNGCRYCSYMHTRLGLKNGLEEGEIRRLLGGDLASAPEHEVVALAFAQHFAESRDRFDPEAWERLVGVYGRGAAQAILIRIRMMTIGNLWGNTLDAFLARFSGRSAPGSNPVSELLIIVLPVAVAPVAALSILLSRLFPRRLQVHKSRSEREEA